MIKHNWKQWDIVGWIAVAILCWGAYSVALIKIAKVWRCQHPPVIPVVKQLPTNHRQLRQAFNPNVDVDVNFMRAIFLQENGDIDNPYCLTEPFIIDACKFMGLDPNAVNKADRGMVKALMIGYFLRYKPVSIQDAAAMYAGGPTGKSKPQHQAYGWRVHNLVELWKQPRALESLCPIKVAIDKNVKVENEYD